MNRRYSIGFFIGIAIVLILVLGNSIRDHKIIEKRNVEPIEDISEYYFVREKDNYVVVYKSDGTVYESTSILVENLPQVMQEQIENGIMLTNLSEVYGFLENYSS